MKKISARERLRVCFRFNWHWRTFLRGYQRELADLWMYTWFPLVTLVSGALLFAVKLMAVLIYPLTSLVVHPLWFAWRLNDIGVERLQVLVDGSSPLREERRKTLADRLRRIRFSREGRAS